VEILASWRKNIEINTNINDEDRELIMTLSPAYLKQREEWRQEGLQTGLQTGLQKGLQTGRQEELRLIVGSLLTARFGNLDEQLLAVVTPIMELSLTERTDLFLNLSQLSREELLAKFPIN
jgi:flagellar biosynthesis/type III secretory pathway protein FliH